MGDHMHASETIGENLLKWASEVDPSDYEAARTYLSITHGPANRSIVILKGEKVVERRANDILRAVHLPPLPMTDPGVLGALKDVLSGKPLSPVLIAYKDIADGYHRVSLAYNLDPFDAVAVKIAN
jgi:hypothetical protein